MSKISFFLNKVLVSMQAADATPLLDVIRRDRYLTGCKEGCREGDCGACLVLIGHLEQERVIYRPATACLIPLGMVAGRHVVTVEGLSAEKPNPIQQALVEHGGIQCGFCTPGIVVALTAFFLSGKSSNAEAAIDAVAGNLCRCTGYAGIKRAIRSLCGQFDLSRSARESRLQDCLQWQLLPPYFVDIAQHLANLPASATNVKSNRKTRIAGGTDWMVQHNKALDQAALDFPTGSVQQPGIRLDGRQCRVAVATTIEQLRTSSILQGLLPNLGQDLELVCSAPIRQHATLGGNLANASPIADLAVMFLALNAELIIKNAGSQRSVPLREFFIGYKHTVLQTGDCISEIRFDALSTDTGFSFEKVGKRIHLDIASVNSGMAVRLAGGLIDSVHLSAGGVGDRPLYLIRTCDYLRGKAVKPEAVLAAAAVAQTEIAPLSDLRGSAEYKRLLLRQLLFAHFLKLFPEYVPWEALHAQG
ncbi:MAG: FAD binding domain-containing protein [Gammaproteobacteria bacterium]